MKRAVALVCLLAFGEIAARQTAAASDTLAARMRSILARPALVHSHVGIQLFDVAANRPIYAYNADHFFDPASTAKVLTVGLALHALGPAYRFHTRVYRTGGLDAAGTLHGDLVLVASGDPNLSARARLDGTLAFNDDDHSYGGSPVQGDPLTPIRAIARQIAARGVKVVDGRVLVDATLFPEGDVEGGTGFVVSPACLNDNIVDVQVAPGISVRAPAVIRIQSPVTSYVTFALRATTGVKASDATIAFGEEAIHPDGSRTVAITGSLPLGQKPTWLQYGVRSPSEFLRFALVDALRDAGVVAIRVQTSNEPDDFASLSKSYRAENLEAEHVSGPLAQDARITLKVSQNLHAQMMPYEVGAIVARDRVDSNRAGLKLEGAWLRSAGLDLSGASQADGEGTASLTPEFMTRYLAFAARQSWFPALFAGLPVLGRDGTLVDIMRRSPAAGRVFAKTGTDELPDYLRDRTMVTAKGLAGYFTTPTGRRIAFAIYVNNISVRNEDDVTNVAGQLVGEIAATAYASLR